MLPIPPRLRLLAAALAAYAVPACAQAPALPETPAGRQVAALLQAVRSPTEQSVREFVNGSMDAQFQEISVEEHLTMFRRIGGDLNGAPIQAVSSPSPESIEVTFGAAMGPLVLRLRTEAAPPHRISGLGIGQAGPDAAAPAEPPPPALDESQRRAIVDSAAQALAAYYVDPDTGRLIGDHLRRRMAAGAYASLSDPTAFADALTADLRAVNGDRHLRARVGPPESRRRAPQPGASSESAYRFLDSVAVLPGNVGYLKFAGIPGAREAFVEVARALRQVERTDALVIDLRGSPGGSAEMANFLISHFTRPGLLSLAVASRLDRDTTMRRTLDQVPGPRRLDVPLYVLIDQGAGSAAEAIPFVLRNLGRATLVGERTGGAGRNNRFFRLPSGFSLSVSVTRVWDPCTGREWERVGVEPHIEVPSARALEVALQAIRDGRGQPADVPEASCRIAAG